MKGVLKINVGACVGCKRCEIQCALAHSQSKELISAASEDPLPRARIKVQQMANWPVPNQCRHCEDAPCIESCPTGALHRESPSGPVLHDANKCEGNHKCLDACPFHAIFRHNGSVYKCDLCIERLAADQQPACAEACPSGSITFSTEETAQEDGRINLPVGAGLAQYELMYQINEESCKGCHACAKGCPASGISGETKEAHCIDNAQCITCGECFRRCKLDAIEIKTAVSLS